MHRYFVSTALASLVAVTAIAPVAKWAIAQNEPQSSKTRLAEHTKPSVVRVVAGCSANYKINNVTYQLAKESYSLGSGFFIHPDGYLVTNAHVVDYAADNHKSCRDDLRRQFLNEYNGTQAEGNQLNVAQEVETPTLYTESDFRDVNWVVLPNKEEAPLDFEIKELGVNIDDSGAEVGGKDVAVLKVELDNAPALLLGNSDNTQLLTQVFTFGYPSKADFDELLDFDSSLEVSVTEGSVSAKDKRTESGVPVLQISAPIARGSSGGPVLNEAGEVIGMVTFGKDDSTNFGFAIYTSTIEEFIRQAGIANEQGEVNELYVQGLDHYNRGDYRRAISVFQKIERLFPEHSEIERLIQDSEAKKSSAVGGLLFIGGGFVGVLAALGAGAYFLMKKKFNQGLWKPASTSYSSNRNGSGDRPYTGPDTVPQNGNIPASTGVFSPATTMSAAPQATVMTLHPYIELKNPQGEVLELTLEKDTHQFGRDRTWSDIVVPENGWTVISRCHATIQREGSEYRIYDGDRSTGSSNGLFINGKRITPQAGYLLKDGDQLKIGQDQRNQVTLTYFKPVV